MKQEFSRLQQADSGRVEFQSGGYLDYSLDAAGKLSLSGPGGYCARDERPLSHLQARTTEIFIGADVSNISFRLLDDFTLVTSIDVEKGNPSYHSAGNCLIDTQNKTLVRGCASSEIPADGRVTSIGPLAFRRVRGPQKDIPDTVRAIEGEAFLNSSVAPSVLPDTLETIAFRAYAGTPVRDVFVSVNTKIEPFAFDDDWTTVHRYPPQEHEAERLENSIAAREETRV